MQQKYSVLSRIFHWASALLLLLVWALIVCAESADGPKQAAVFMSYHKAFGLCLGLFVLARLCNRWLSKTPPAVKMAKWQQLAASATHAALYVLLIIQPAAGLLMSLYSGREVNFFGVFTIPAMPVNDAFADWLNQLHVSVFWPMIWILTLIHIVTALYHHFVQKDGTLKRML